MARVKLEKVRKVYDNGFVALDGASFDVRDGEFMVLVGPSGCGKSTTLRMIAGLEGITAGQIAIGDRIVNDIPPKDRDIAMVFQNYALYPHMSVYDNMAFGLKLRKCPKAEIDERVRQAAEMLGLEAILDRKPKQLSGGQRQRVAVGRALVRQPQVFLFDEPLSNLDAKLRVQMRAEIAQLHRRLGATMIYVTHDQVEAMTMGERIVVLREGHIQQIAAPLVLYNRPVNRFVAGFIGSPAMNFVEGRIERVEGLQFVAGDGDFAVPVLEREAAWAKGYVGKAVTLGVRPEDVYLADSPYLRGPSAEVELRLEVVEPMGHEVVLYAGLGGEPLVGRVAPQDLPAAGEAVMLAFDVGKLHFFDPETEVRLNADETIAIVDGSS